MIYFNNLPDKQQESNQVFYATGVSCWQTWQKPTGVKNVYIFCIGGGGGGQAGAGGAAGASRAGGTGGSASAYSFGTFSANMLPDTLFINVGPGGVGGVGSGGAGENGAAGSISYISVTSSSAVTQNILIASGAVAAAATNGSVNTPTAGAVWSFATGYVLPFMGLVAYNAGANGTPAGTGTGAGASVTVNNFVTGGAAGGGVTVNTPSTGGNITGSGFFTGLLGGTAGGNGGSGGYASTVNFSVRNPFFFTGGAGGGSINSGVGGAGGNAGFGCGGGGGGAGTTGGNGGKGGDGLVIITAW